MIEALKAWRTMAARHGSRPGIDKCLLQRAVFEGQLVMAKLSNAGHDRNDVCAHFARVAALYVAAKLFSI